MRTPPLARMLRESAGSLQHDYGRTTNQGQRLQKASHFHDLHNHNVSM
jgi:hypothetical protein